jgi:hypothetical protein
MSHVLLFTAFHTVLHVLIGCVARIALYRASSAIGLELARLLYLDGFSLILVSRYCTAPLFIALHHTVVRYCTAVRCVAFYYTVVCCTTR